MKYVLFIGHPNPDHGSIPMLRIAHHKSAKNFLGTSLTDCDLGLKGIGAYQKTRIHWGRTPRRWCSHGRIIAAGRRGVVVLAVVLVHAVATVVTLFSLVDRKVHHCFKHFGCFFGRKIQRDRFWKKR